LATILIARTQQIYIQKKNQSCFQINAKIHLTNLFKTYYYGQGSSWYNKSQSLKNLG
jgi:hypothetical protein